MPEFEPEAHRVTGNEAFKAAVSTAISARRAADTLDRILLLLAAPRPRPWWQFWTRR